MGPRIWGAPSITLPSVSEFRQPATLQNSSPTSSSRARVLLSSHKQRCYTPRPINHQVPEPEHLFSVIMDPLACGNCGRTYSTVPTLARHRLRCKSRPKSRKKACSECARSKVRCDQGVPSCSRCAIHGLPCVYPHEGGLHQIATPPSNASAVTPSAVSAHVPLTPSSIPSQPIWTSVVDQEPDLTAPLNPFSEPNWVPDLPDDWREPFFLFDLGQGGAEVSSANVSAPMSTASNSQGDTQSSEVDILQDSSVHITDKWSTAEQGLDLIDRVLKSYVDGVAQGLHRPPFIHHWNWDHNRRPLVLAEATAVAQLYATTTPQSDAVLLRFINTQLLSLQRNITTQPRADDISMMQATLLYSMMRIYRSGPMASECIDRVPLRLLQHVLSKSIHCMTPHTNVTPNDWESWIQDESLRRCFLTLHALDHVTHARAGLPGVICALFPASPLPCPPDVWEAPTAEAWAVRHRAWEARCAPGGPVRAGEVLAWVRGEGTEREGLFREWFVLAGEAVGGLVLECARAQARVVGVEGLVC
ncbi:uncharacterized protein B0H64DRAFT_427492 [Chaetomium fimeti]|uniref:Zn(2)-C6 fungal-type domain-containing protein n=1 Tax=Chaetomium fimeti TaxID=1854472 RepID=A0AAE0H6V0_9PEZI|nr:hypothetical protein B0H64DRAFT_427492 [Chaetomium fimeti]